MGLLLSVREILDFAVYIEQNGYRFYVETAKKLRQPKLLELFQYLADEEFKHEQLFAKLRDDAQAFRPPESYDGEYQAYMKEFCKAHTLANREALQGRIGAIESAAGAVELALSFEKDSVVFFTELKELVPAERQGAVQTVIREEMMHLRRIVDFKRQLGL